MEQTFTEIKRPVSRDAKTGQFVMAAFFLGIIGMGSFLAGIMYFQPLYLAITFGAVLAGWMLFDRKRHHDGLHTVSTTRTGAEPEPAEKIKPEIYRDGGRVINYGNYALTHDEWKALSKIIFAHDNKFVRDVVAKAKVFTDITAPGRWTEIKRDFENIGLVKNNELTNDGIGFFSNFSPYPNN